MPDLDLDREALAEGRVFTLPYPFVLEDREIAEVDGIVTIKSWRPGIRFEICGPGDSEAVADAVGQQILEIVSLHKPGKFPARIFYTQRWISPTSRAFGKTKLRIATVPAFRQKIRGYRYEYRLEGADAAAA